MSSREFVFAMKIPKLLYSNFRIFYIGLLILSLCLSSLPNSFADVDTDATENEKPSLSFLSTLGLGKIFECEKTLSIKDEQKFRKDFVILIQNTLDHNRVTTEVENFVKELQIDEVKSIFENRENKINELVQTIKDTNAAKRLKIEEGDTDRWTDKDLKELGNLNSELKKFINEMDEQLKDLEKKGADGKSRISLQEETKKKLAYHVFEIAAYCDFDPDKVELEEAALIIRPEEIQKASEFILPLIKNLKEGIHQLKTLGYLQDEENSHDEITKESNPEIENQLEALMETRESLIKFLEKSKNIMSPACLLGYILQINKSFGEFIRAEYGKHDELIKVAGESLKKTKRIAKELLEEFDSLIQHGKQESKDSNKVKNHEEL